MDEHKIKSAENSLAGAITDDLFLKVVDLARLDPLAPSMAIHRDEFRKILEHFSVLSRVDISDVDPAIHINTVRLPFSDDEPVETLTRDDALSNTRLRTSEYFLAPKILDSGNPGGR
jgi:aspartyl/glutamyl-tRNA(Asn/Gln) amidotransferase C subunit